MDITLSKQIEDRFDELPEDVQKAIKSSDVDQKIQTVAKKHQLHIDQIESLDIETRLVMLGFVDPSEFPEEIKSNVKVTQEQAELIAQDISTQIFMPIRESMRQYSEEKSTREQIVQELPNEKKEDSDTKSVVMPSSSVKPTTSVSPIPVPVTVPQSTTPPTSATPTKPESMAVSAPKLIEIHAADLMLNEPTVSMSPKTATPPTVPSAPAAPVTPTPAVPAANSAKVEPPKPAPYKADPYREPPE